MKRFESACISVWINYRLVSISHFDTEMLVALIETIRFRSKCLAMSMFNIDSLNRFIILCNEINMNGIDAQTICSPNKCRAFMNHEFGTNMFVSPRVFLFEKERTLCIINRFVKCLCRHHGHVCNPERDFSLLLSLKYVFTMTVHSNCRRICSSTETFELEFFAPKGDVWLNFFPLFRYAPTNDTFVCPK